MKTLTKPHKQRLGVGSQMEASGVVCTVIGRTSRTHLRRLGRQYRQQMVLHHHLQKGWTGVKLLKMHSERNNEYVYHAG